MYAASDADLTSAKNSFFEDVADTEDDEFVDSVHKYKDVLTTNCKPLVSPLKELLHALLH